MGLFVCTNEAVLTISSSQCDTEGQCNRAGRAGKQIITNRTPTTKTDRSEATDRGRQYSGQIAISPQKN